MVRSPARPWLVPIALLAAAVLPATAHASVSITRVQLQPSTTAAGGHPNLVTDTTFDENPSSDDVKSLRVVLPQGLVGDPTAADRCSQSAFQADNCPAASKVGSAELTAVVTVPPGLDMDQTSPGDIYQLEPVGSEAGRFGMIVRPPPIGLFSFPKIFLQAPITIGPDTDYGLSTAFDNLPRQVGSFDIRIKESKLTMNGNAARGPFITNPTNCRQATMTISATSYDSPGTATGSASFTPTACDALAFGPTLSATIGGQGLTGKNGSPSLTTVLTVPAGQANVSSVKVVLPSLVGPNVAALGRVCPADGFAAGNCPSTSRVGEARASSPLLPQTLVGPMLLVAPPSGGLPRLAIVFGGTFPLTLLGDAALEGGKITNTLSGLPDLPIGSVQLTIDGGASGLVTNLVDLCGRGAGDKLSTTLTAQSGRTAVLSVPLDVQGCVSGSTAIDKPRASMRLLFGGDTGVLTAHFKAGRGGGRITHAQLTLAPGLKGGRRGLSVSAARRLKGKALQLRGRTLDATIKRKGVLAVALRWRGIKASRKVALALAQRTPLKFVAVLTDSAGRTTKLRVPVKPTVRRR